MEEGGGTQQERKKRMTTLGNILWFILGGWIAGTVWVLMGSVCYVTIIGIPFGTACFRIASFAYFPFGKELVDARDVGEGRIAMTGLGNFLWVVLFGLWNSIFFILAGIAMCCGIVTIPFGFAYFKLAAAGFAPLGKRIVSTDMARVIRERKAARELDQRMGEGNKEGAAQAVTDGVARLKAAIEDWKHTPGLALSMGLVLAIATICAFMCWNQNRGRLAVSQGWGNLSETGYSVPSQGTSAKGNSVPRTSSMSASENGNRKQLLETHQKSNQQLAIEDQLELLNIYRKKGQRNQYFRLASHLLDDPATPVDAILSIAGLFALDQNIAAMAYALETASRRDPSRPNVWINLAATYAWKNRTEDALNCVRQALATGGAEARNDILQDARFQPLANNREFRSLVLPSPGALPTGLAK